jgi:YD repeat-containing protein
MRVLLSAFLFTAWIAQAQVTVLTCGVVQNSSITTDTPQRSFQYRGDAGEAIAIRVVTNPASLALTPELRSPNNTVIPYRTTSPVSLSVLEYDLPTAGDYLFSVRGKDAGTFQIVLIKLNRPCGNTTLACGTPVSGKITAGTQLQVYQFDGKTGDQVSLRLLRTGGDNQSSLMVLGYDSAGLQQKVTSDGKLLGAAGLPAVRLDYKLTSDGPQIFLVGEYTGTLKQDYSISMLRLNGGCSARPVSCGAVTDGAINSALGTNLYTFTAVARDQYLMRIRGVNSATFEPSAQIFDPQSNIVQIATSSDRSRAVFTPAVSGAYTVVLADATGLQTGNYALAMLRLNGGCNTQALGCGAVADGKVDGLLRFTAYTVNSQANDVYLLRLLRTDAGGSFRPAVEIYGPDGTTVQSATTPDFTSISFTAPAAGAYMLVAWDGFDGSQSGTYSMSATRINRPCEGVTALGCGTLASATIDRPLKAGVYSYATAAGDAFSIKLIDTAGTLQSSLQVYDPLGRAVGPPVSGNIKSVDVARAAAGAYTVLVTDDSRNARQGTYVLQSFATTGSCGATPPQGQTVSGLVSGTAPFQSYVFRAAAGDALLLRSAGLTPGFAINMDLYDPAGNRLGNGTFAISRTAPADGQYTVITGSSSPRSAGSYGFSWQSLNNPAPETPPLQCGRTVVSSLAPEAQFRYYTVNVNGGDILKLLLTRMPDNLNAQLELFDSAGARVAGSNSEISRSATAGGRYLVLVSPATAFAESGGFALAFQRPNNPCSPAALACGQTVLQAVTTPGQLDAFTFSGNPGDRITLRVLPRTGSFSPYLELYGPTGSLVPGSGAVSTLSATLSASDRYTVLLRDRSGANTGSYRIGLQRGNNDCPENDSQKPTIRLRRPTGGEVISGGTAYRIAWESDDNVDVTSHAVRLSTDGGKTFPVTIREGLSGLQQSVDWIVPADIAPTRTAVIQVTATDRAGNSQSAASDLLTLIGSGFTPNTSVSYVFDGLNRIVQATYGDGRVVRYTYDVAGNLLQVTVQ